MMKGNKWEKTSDANSSDWEKRFHYTRLVAHTDSVQLPISVSAGRHILLSPTASGGQRTDGASHKYQYLCSKMTDCFKNVEDVAY